MAKKSRSTPRAVLFLFIAALSLLVSTAGAAPEAAFISNVTTGPAPLTVQFNDTSTGDPDGWAWYFGDETYGREWTNQIDAAGWAERHGSASVVMPNGNIIIMGGGSIPTTANVWRSTDKGKTWENITPQDPNTIWQGRHAHAAVLVGDSIVLMGGYGLGYKKDVWRSDDEGETWTQVVKQAEWKARYYHTSVVMPNGNIIIMGGSGSTKETKQMNETWRSTNKGATWTRLSDAEWPARYSHTSVVMPNGNIIIMGGYDGGWRNDVWRSTNEGVTWTRVAEHAEWPERSEHTSVVMPDGSIIIMGGWNKDGYLNDTWRSTDEGATWTRMAEHAEWKARHEHNSVVMPDGSVILMAGVSARDGGGYTYRNDVWRLETAGSTAKHPTHTYTEPGTYTVALQACNADGYNAMREIGYITVTVPTPTPTATPTATPIATPSSSGDSGSGGSTVGPDGSYNVGGDSAVSTVTATGTGLNMLIVTGWKRSSPGTGIPPAPGIVYQYIDLTPARFETITSANLTFSVPDAWLAENNLTPDEMAMYRYHGTAWETLPTQVVGNAGAMTTFRAASSGFSLFAISGIRGERAVTPVTTQPIAEQTTAVPVGDTAPDFPLQTVALIAGGVLVLAGAGYFTRRWWVRRQSPTPSPDDD